MGNMYYLLLEELREKPIIGMISGLLSTLMSQSPYQAPDGMFWWAISHIAIACTGLIAVLTLILKIKEFYDRFFRKKKY